MSNPPPWLLQRPDPDSYEQVLRHAVLEAEEFAEVDDFNKGIAMGLRMAAALYGMPEGIDPDTRKLYGLDRRPDGLPNDWWTSEDCARYLRIDYGTWTGYVSRGQAPTHDRKFGRTKAWRPATVMQWRSNNPGELPETSPSAAAGER